MQLARRCKRGDSTYLTVMVEIKPDRVLEGPDSTVELLDESADVMPADLPDGVGHQSPS